MNTEFTNLLESLVTDRSTVVNSMDKISLATPITLKEPTNLVEAIKLYKKRIRLLEIVVNYGFDTMADYNRFKEAEDVVAKHKKKMAEDVVAKHKKKMEEDVVAKHKKKMEEAEDAEETKEEHAEETKEEQAEDAEDAEETKEEQAEETKEEQCKETIVA